MALHSKSTMPRILIPGPAPTLAVGSQAGMVSRSAAAAAAAVADPDAQADASDAAAAAEHHDRGGRLRTFEPQHHDGRLRTPLAIPPPSPTLAHPL
eukprot:2992169-Rhodomonas_salina.2